MGYLKLIISTQAISMNLQFSLFLRSTFKHRCSITFPFSSLQRVLRQQRCWHLSFWNHRLPLRTLPKIQIFSLLTCGVSSVQYLYLFACISISAPFKEHLPQTEFQLNIQRMNRSFVLSLFKQHNLQPMIFSFCCPIQFSVAVFCSFGKRHCVQKKLKLLQQFHFLWILHTTC